MPRRRSATPGRRRRRRAAHRDADHLHDHEAPELASGEVDIADAQLALGRPELIDTTAAQVPDAVDDDHDLPELADEEQFEELEDRVDDAEQAFEEGANGHVEDGAEVVARHAVAAPRAQASRARATA